jgi:ABC transport system ATP-binding/permease protein
MALINIQDVSIAFGGPPVLDRVSLQIQQGERVCLLGRNGTGKTTLMRIIDGGLEPDQGTVSRQQGVTTALLTQEVPVDITGTVFDIVLSGLGERGQLPVQYHHLSVRLAEEHSEALMKQLDQVQKALEINDGWDIHRQAETVITRMKLDAEAEFSSLSAGMKRRVLLGRALVSRPDILLLDEPTNHLDIDAIAWMEEFLLRTGGTMLFVTHDRMLVKKISNRVIELDRGILTSWNCNYETYLERKDAALEVERRQWEVFDKKMDKEEVWIRQGIKARRTRNEGRVNALIKMREERSSRREQVGRVKMQLVDARKSGRLVMEAENVSFDYDERDEREFKFQNDSQNDSQKDTELNTPQDKKTIIRDLTTLIMRGDRVGIIGPNGSGKTTLLKVLLGELYPREGRLRLGTNLEVAYFDQLRGQLDDRKSVQDNVADGNDRILMNGKTKHVIGYLQEFLFSPERARSPVKVLSGGERNRLLLAKLFAKPSNLLVMDEPTNDLDIETLELLEELLLDYSGTLLLVSHDRTFLNNVVTSTLVFEEGDGTINEYVGGYDDWQIQRPRSEQETQKTRKTTVGSGKNDNADSTDTTDITGRETARPRKLTYKETQELEALPLRIEELEEEQEKLFRLLADPEVYKQENGGEKISHATKRAETVKQELTIAYQRWEELEEIQNRHAGFKKMD